MRSHIQLLTWFSYEYSFRTSCFCGWGAVLYSSWTLINSIGSRQSTYKPHQPFTRTLLILIRTVTRVQPTSGGGLRPVACKALGIHYILFERDVTFGVLGGPQKCINIYGKIAMPPFKLRATPQLYSMRYLSEYSVKLETSANTWNFESGELIVAFSRNKSTCPVRGVVYAVTAEVKILECLFIAFPTSECIQSEERSVWNVWGRYWAWRSRLFKAFSFWGCKAWQ